MTPQRTAVRVLLGALVAAALMALAAGAPTAVAAESTTASGRLEVVHEDHFDAGRSAHLYNLIGEDGTRTQLLFDDRGPEGLGGRNVRVTGRQERPGVMRVGTSAAVAEAGGGSGSGTTTTTAATVTKKVAVILYDFANSGDTLSRPVSAQRAREVVFGTAASTEPTVRQFLTETSFGQLALSGAATPDGDVFDWVRLDAQSTDNCAYGTWGQQARNLAAAEQGFVDGNYDQVVHLMPSSTCNFGGVAYMPGKYSWTVLRKADDPHLIAGLRRTTSHEYGHNLGIHHAGSYRCTDGAGEVVTLSAACTVDEYGDPFSVLGMSVNERQYHGYQKGRVSWVTQANTTTVTASGTYDLASISSSPASAPQVLRIARPRSKGQSDYYYLELRQPSGSFDDFADNDPMVTGLSVRLAPDYGLNGISKLLDMTPRSVSAPPVRIDGFGGDFSDAALPRGQVYTDSAMGLTIELLSITAGVAKVEITMPVATTRPRK